MKKYLATFYLSIYYDSKVYLCDDLKTSCCEESNKPLILNLDQRFFLLFPQKKTKVKNLFVMHRLG